MSIPAYTPPPEPGPLVNGLRVFTCTDHDYHWPVGVASVVVAIDEPQARGLLDTELAAHRLDPRKPYTLVEIGTHGPVAVVLNDGQY